MEFVKNDILKLIKESTQEMGEMAQKPEGEVTWRPVFLDEQNNDLVIGRVKKLEEVPHRQIGFVYHDTYCFVYTDKDEIDAFCDANPKLIEQLKAKYGENAGFKPEVLPVAKPRKKSLTATREKSFRHLGDIDVNTTQPPPTSTYDAREFILKGGNFNNKGARDKDGTNRAGLYKLIERFLETKEVENHLAKCGIPEIKNAYKNREFLNRHGEISNQKIEYGTHHYHLYDSAEEFVDAVISRTRGNEDDAKMISSHLARRWNKERPNWDPTKMSKKEYLGKTPKYKLDKYGLKEINPEIQVRSTLSIDGELDNESNMYLWTVKFVTDFGEKLKEQFHLGKFSVDKDFVITRHVNYKKYYDFDDMHPVLFNPDIRQGLISALEELQKDILAINPLDTVDLVKLRPSETELAENYIKQIEEKVFNSLKK